MKQKTSQNRFFRREHSQGSCGARVIKTEGLDHCSIRVGRPTTHCVGNGVVGSPLFNLVSVECVASTNTCRPSYGVASDPVMALRSLTSQCGDVGCRVPVTSVRREETSSAESAGAKKRAPRRDRTTDLSLTKRVLYH